MSTAIRTQVRTPEEEVPETLVEITNPIFGVAMNLAAPGTFMVGLIGYRPLPTST